MKTNLSVYRYKLLSLIFGTCLAIEICSYIFDDSLNLIKPHLYKIAENIKHNESFSINYELMTESISSEIPKFYYLISLIIEVVSCMTVFWIVDHLTDSAKSKSKNEN